MKHNKISTIFELFINAIGVAGIAAVVVLSLSVLATGDGSLLGIH